MKLTVSNLTIATALGLVLVGCSGAEPDSAPPPPPPAAAYDRAPVDLAGAPPVPDQDGLASGSDAALDPLPDFVGMAPIPNPEDLPPAERHRIYGTKYDDQHRVAREDDVPTSPAQSYAAAPPFAARPAPARRTVTTTAARPAPVPPAPARPAVVAKPPSTAAPVPRAPAGQPAAPPPVAAAAMDPRLAKLQTALAPQVSSAATLTLSAPLSQRLEGPVVLTLPQNLFDLVREEAAKLGLARSARISEANATLSGQGYEITPSGPQTARLKSGEAASFQWQVKPGAGELGPLRAQIDAALRGQRPPMTFPLTAVEKAVTVTIPEAAKRAFQLPRLDLGTLNLGGVRLPDNNVVDVPVLGRTNSQTLLGAGLLLLAVLVLIGLARNAAEAKARARRRHKVRAMANDATGPGPTVATRVYRDTDGDGVPDTRIETRTLPAEPQRAHEKV